MERQREAETINKKSPRSIKIMQSKKRTEPAKSRFLPDSIAKKMHFNPQMVAQEGASNRPQIVRKKMLALNLNEKYTNEIVQTNWKNGRIPHFSGVVVGNGEMIAMGEQTYSHNNTFEFHAYPIVKSTISSFMEFSDAFIEPTIMESRVYIPEAKCYAVCGEGPMGNEGFVALVRDETLVWSIFFTISNPFYEIRRVGDCVFAKSTHDVFWEFPLTTPWNTRVLGSEFKDWPE